jgi:PIN domain nuclease of toxin-antitoxin system
LNEPAILSPAERNAIADESNSVAASVASLWEIAIKQRSGKLKLPAPAADWLPPLIDGSKFDTLNITRRHAFAAGALPAHHRDPFDRMLVAQALTDDFVLVTRDQALRRYGVSTFEN